MDFSSLFKLNKKDLMQAATNAIVIGVVSVLYGVANSAGFDVFTADWISIGHMVVNASISAFVASLGSSFLTTKEGKVLGAISVK